MSLRKSVDMKCKDCIYDELAPGSWRKQTEACEMTNCPLYDVRPTTGKTREDKRQVKMIAAKEVV